MTKTNQLSDRQLWDQTRTLVSREREATAQVLTHLLEIERRKLYLQRGYGSLFTYCTAGLGYTEAEAQLRISSMRLLKDLGSESGRAVQNTLQKIEAGKYSLSNLAQTQAYFNRKRYDEKLVLNQREKARVLQKIEGRSTRQAQRVLAELSPDQSQPRRDEVRELGNGTVRLSVTLDAESEAMLQEFIELTAHQNPLGKKGEAIKLALKIALEISKKKRKSATCRVRENKSQKNKDLKRVAPAVKILKTRYVQKAAVRAAWKNSEDQCSWVDRETGRRCDSRYKLQLDHRIPFSKGGQTIQENIQLLCANHNAFKSDKIACQGSIDRATSSASVGKN